MLENQATAWKKIFITNESFGKEEEEWRKYLSLLLYVSSQI